VGGAREAGRDLRRDLRQAPARANRRLADDDELSPELLAERAAALYEGLGETKETPKPRLLTEDVTPEGLASLLADHGRIVAASDEGAILFENFSGRYAHGSANWDLLNKAHSAGDLVVDRKTTGTAFVWDPALTLVLATQPRVLSDLWGKPGAEARGVLARPLYALPDPVYEIGRTPAADVDVLVEYERRVRALYEDVPVLMFDEDDRPLPLTLRLDPDAETLFERYELELASERRRLGISDNAEQEAGYLGWLSKLAGQTARLAACLHASEHWSNGTAMNTTIDADTVARAVELARYFHAHALVVFGLMGELPEQRRAQTILRWLKGRGDDELAALTVRDVHRSRGRGTTAEQVRTALRLLEDHGYVQLERQKPAKQAGARRSACTSTPHSEILASRPTKPTKPLCSVRPLRVLSVTSVQTPKEFGVEHRSPGCQVTRAWRARDGEPRHATTVPPGSATTR
jgi:replicative DNA helicase